MVAPSKHPGYQSLHRERTHLLVVASVHANAEDINDRAKLIIHRFVARSLMRDPTLVTRARHVVDGWRGAPEYDFVAEWEHLLRLPASDLARVLVRREEAMCRLRASSPFRGMLTASTTLISDCGFGGRPGWAWKPPRKSTGLPQGVLGCRAAYVCRAMVSGGARIAARTAGRLHRPR